MTAGYSAPLVPDSILLGDAIRGIPYALRDSLDRAALGFTQWGGTAASATAAAAWRKMRDSKRLLLGIVLLTAIFSSVGCSSFQDRRSLQRLDMGYTIVLPGIQGESVLNGRIAQGLVDSGLPTAIEVDDWTSRFAPAFLFHLRGTARHRREASRIAGKITDYSRAYPGRPVYLVGHSGGAAMAVYIMELLPPDVSVTRAVLLAPALSPEYDLSRALAATDGGIWSFHSPGDLVFCGLGTTVFGSIDGKFRPSAGAVGFRDEAGRVIGDLEAGTYLPADGARVPLRDLQWGQQLRQIPYRPEMIATGHPGGHFGWVNYHFAKQYLAPLLDLEFAP